jgi:hypothetical protein
MNKAPIALVLLLSSATFQPGAAGAQPAHPAPATGDIARVRDCSAVIATYPAMRVDPTRACTEMACSSGVSVDTSAAGRGAGAYHIEVEADGQRFACDVRLPLNSCNDSTLCTWTRPGSFHRISVARSGCVLPAAQQGLTSVDFEGVCPAHVRVRMLRNGAEVGRYESDVDYRRVVANGEGCGPVCAQGRLAARPRRRR